MQRSFYGAEEKRVSHQRIIAFFGEKKYYCPSPTLSTLVNYSTQVKIVKSKLIYSMPGTKCYCGPINPNKLKYCLPFYLVHDLICLYQISKCF